MLWTRIKASSTSSHAVALGAALGVGFSSVPLPLFGLLAAPLLAPLVHASPLAALLGTTLVNPITGPFLYGAELLIGLWLTGREPLDWQTLLLLDSAGLKRLMLESLTPLFLGTSVMLPLVMGVTYGIVWLLMHRYHLKK